MKIKYSEVLYFLALVLFIIYNYLAKTMLIESFPSFTNAMIKLMKVTSVVLLTSKIIICDKYKIKELLIYALIMVFVLVSSYITDSYELFWLYIFVISAKNIVFTKIIKFTTIINFMFLVVIISMASLGIINNLTNVTVNNVTGEIVTRHLLGFRHVNFLGSIIFSVYL